MHWFREAWLLFPPNSQDGIFGLKSCQYEIGTFLGYTQVSVIWLMGPESGPQKLHLSCSTAARWGCPKLLGAGAKYCTEPGCKEIFQVSGSLWLHLLSSEAEQKARRRDEDILCPSLPLKLNWSLPALLKIVILDKRLCNNLRNVWEDLVLILYKPSLTSGSLKSNLAELTRAVNMEPLDSGIRENWLTNLQYFDFFFFFNNALCIFESIFLCVKIHLWLHLYGEI